MLKSYLNFIKEANETMGKNLFKDYLKVFSALGLKDTKVNYQTSPDEFLIYFISIPVQTTNVKSVMSRFSQFNQFINSLDYNYNECQLYYGIKCDMMFEYGILSEENKIVFGQFPITKSNYRWLILLDSPSAANLKKEIVSFSADKLNLLSKIKSEVKKFSPGETEKRTKAELIDGIMRFSYQGLSNGNLQPDQFQILKDNLMNYLLKYKWSDKIQISLTQNNPWLHLNIKLK